MWVFRASLMSILVNFVLCKAPIWDYYRLTVMLALGQLKRTGDVVNIGDSNFMFLMAN